MNLPLITVCIPVYNGAKYLDVCLRSVINQTYKNIEILVVDDCSIDDSRFIVAEYSKFDIRIKYILNDVNLGMVKNWNKCIHLSSGQWLKFIFQDDFMEPNCLEKMYNSSIINCVDLVICSRHFLIDESASFKLKSFFQDDVLQLKNIFHKSTILDQNQIVDISCSNLFNNFIGEPNVFLLKKKTFEKIGYFNEQMRQLVDYEFLLRAILNLRSFFLIDNLVTFRVHGNSVSDSHLKSIEKHFFIDSLEPLILIHEYLINKKYYKIKKKIGKFELLKLNSKYYQKFKLLYKQPKFSNDFKILLVEFPYLKYQILIGELIFYLTRKKKT